MSKDKIAILTPFYKRNLDTKEKRRLEVSLSYLWGYDHFFLAPEELNFDLLKLFPNAKIKRCSGDHLKSTNTYNKYLLTSEFYSQFSDYSHIMILQLDALVMRSIKDLRFQDYDYIGSPWEKAKKITIYKDRLYEDSRRHSYRLHTRIEVGNGGLSIRRVESMLKLVEFLHINYPFLTNGEYNEDIVISFLCKKLRYKLPRKKQAKKIFCEELAAKLKKPGEVYGYHALDRFNPELENLILSIPCTQQPL